MRLVLPIGLPCAIGCSGGGGMVVGPDTGTDGDVTPDAGDAGMDAPYNGMDPVVTPGAPDRILLVGTIVTPDQVIDGQVLVEAGIITCVDAGSICSTMMGAMG